MRTSGALSLCELKFVDKYSVLAISHPGQGGDSATVVPERKKRGWKYYRRGKYLNHGTIRGGFYMRQANKFKGKWGFSYLAMYKGTQINRGPSQIILVVPRPR